MLTIDFVKIEKLIGKQKKTICDLCNELGVSRSMYYSWRDRDETGCYQGTSKIKLKNLAVLADSLRCYPQDLILVDGKTQETTYTNNSHTLELNNQMLSDMLCNRQVKRISDFCKEAHISKPSFYRYLNDSGSMTLSTLNNYIEALEIHGTKQLDLLQWKEK